MNQTVKNMLCMIVLAVSAIPSFSEDNAGLNFDHGIDIKAIISQINESAIETPIVDLSEKLSENTYTERLISVKELMKGMSAENRIEFLSKLLWENGKVTAVNDGILNRENIPADVLLVFGAPALLSEPSQGVKLEDLLRDVSKNAREDFIDNMVFLNGTVVTVKYSALEAEISPTQLQKIINTLMPATASKSIEKNTQCIAVVTPSRTTDRKIERSCDYKKGSSCNPTSCN